MAAYSSLTLDMDKAVCVNMNEIDDDGGCLDFSEQEQAYCYNNERSNQLKVIIICVVV